MDTLPSIDPGRRATIAGKTGTGKSTLAVWLLERSPQSWIILNPKHTAAYRKLPDSIIFRRFDAGKIRSALRRYKYVSLNFSNDEADPEFLDAVIDWLHNDIKNVGLCADELYTLHSASGRAGDGLIGWLTRGRELKQSFLGLTQRPAWISRFLFSEADFVGSMKLTREDDRKRMVQETGRREFANRLQGHQWLWYNDAADDITLYGPVPVSQSETSQK